MRHAGLGIGAALLAHAAEETRRAGVELLRVDCWAGGGGELVAFYERNGFAPASRFMSGDWPGQVLTHAARLTVRRRSATGATGPSPPLPSS